MASKKSNYWIVTAFPFAEHGSYALAKKESERLAEKWPDKTFKVIRCKREVEKDSSSAEYIREMESRHAAFMEEVRGVLRALTNAAKAEAIRQDEIYNIHVAAVAALRDAERSSVDPRKED